jgi:hypothetical protein
MKSADIDCCLRLYGGAGHSFTNPSADSRGIKGFFNQRRIAGRGTP